MKGILSDKQIEELLKTNFLGRIGCRDKNDVYVVPINYAYDGKNIIAHSLPGEKIRMMRDNPRVCFEIDEITSFTNWKSVIIQGTYEELLDEKERYQAMDTLVNLSLRLKISETAILPENSAQRIHPRSPGNIKPVIFRIVPVIKTGRFETDE